MGGSTLRVQSAKPTVVAEHEVIIFADDFFSPHFVTGPVFGSVKRILEQVIRPGDAVMVVAWRQRVEIRQDFTDDLANVGLALDRIADESGRRMVLDRALQLRAEARAVDQFLKDVAALHGGMNCPATADSLRLTCSRIANRPYPDDSQRVIARVIRVSS